MNILQHQSFSNGGILVWAKTFCNICTDLRYFINNIVSSQKYCDKVFYPYVCPRAGAIDSDLECHATQSTIVSNYQIAKRIQRIEWWTCSPNRNPDALRRAVASQQIFQVFPESFKMLLFKIDDYWLQNGFWNIITKCVLAWYNKYCMLDVIFLSDWHFPLKTIICHPPPFFLIM